jgi:fibronectin-binding autotransporter adhesin
MKQRLIMTRRIVSTFIFTIALAVAQFTGVQFAHATTTDTWTGTAGDSKFSTATNWSGGVAPSAGDIVSFNSTSLGAATTLNNDMTGLSLGGIIFTGTNTNYYQYDLTGNAVTLTGGITSSGAGGIVTFNMTLGTDITNNGRFIYGDSTVITTQGHALSITGAEVSCYSVPQLLGSGALNVSLSADSILTLPSTNTSGYTGSIAVSSGLLLANTSASFGAASGVTVSGTASLLLYASADNQTYATPLILSGTGHLSAEHSSSNGCGGSAPSEVYTTTQSGAVTLGSDFSYNGEDNLNVTGTYTPNGHSFTVTNGSSGTLTVPGSSAQAAPVVTDTYSDSQPTTNVFAGKNQTVVLDGARQYVTIDYGAILMGSGTALAIYIGPASIVAPGHSPGKLTATQTLTIAGSYQAQIKDATAGDYDQIQVSDPSRTTGNDVNIATGAKLDTSLYTGWSIKQGDQFMIIKNLQPSTQKVIGTFTGLAEGAQFTVSGITFSISYVGGDGNDVVLTALTTGKAPTAPNTSIASLKLANPAVLAGLGVVAAGILFTLARRRFNK